jgi:hypothetical protein
VQQRLARRNVETGKPQETLQCVSGNIVGLVDDQENLASLFVLFEPCMLEITCCGHRIIDGTIEPRYLANTLQHLLKGESGVPHPACLIVPMIETFEQGTEQQGLSQSCLPHQRHTSLCRGDIVQEGLQNGLMAWAQKQKGWIRRVRERILCQVVKLAIHRREPLTCGWMRSPATALT